MKSIGTILPDYLYMIKLNDVQKKRQLWKMEERCDKRQTGK